MNIALGIVLLSYLGLLVWMWFKGRSARSSEHEGTPNSVPWLKLTATLLATAVGGGLIFGLISFGRIAGMVGALIAAVYCLSFIALGLISPRIRKACDAMRERGVLESGESLSVPALLANKYSAGTWGLMMALYGVIYLAFLAAQYVAMARLLQALNLAWPVPTMVAVSALAVFAYIALGGFKAVLETDWVQLLVILVICIVGVLLAIGNDGFDASALPSNYWDPLALGTETFVWLSLFIFPTLLLRLDHWQRMVTAESDRAATTGYVVAGLVLVPVFGTFLFLGAGSAMAGSDSPFYVFQRYFLGQGGELRSLAYGISLVALLWAVLSSADTILNSSSSAIVQSLRAWNVIRGEGIVPIRLASLVLSVLAVVVALALPRIVSLITEGFKAMTILLPTVAAAILLKRPRSGAALASLIAGGFAYGCIAFIAGAKEWGYVVGFATALITILLAYRIQPRDE